jgi:biopolymer transport protein ExbD
LIKLNAEGHIELQGTAVELDKLDEKLTELSGQGSSDVDVAIWAADECPYRHVAAVLKQCRAANVDSVQLATETR